ncbi:MAG: hypothetical protein ABI016_04175 [Chthoniobacterales bacterium]
MSSPSDPPPNEKQLRFASFVIHATRGLIRHRKARRNTMFIGVLVALVMLFCGATFLAPVLSPHERPGWFILYWFACAWVTTLVLLLAILDLLLVRIEARDAKRALQNQITPPPEKDDGA